MRHVMHAAAPMRAFNLSAYVSQLILFFECPCSTMSSGRKAQSLPELASMTSSTMMVSYGALPAQNGGKVCQHVVYRHQNRSTMQQ